jgi:putative endonuclease
MHYVYIIYSQKKKAFYIGESTDVNSRLEFHNNPDKNTNSTLSGIPWEIFWVLQVENRIIARKIEAHIKRMRNQKYYHNLKSYPEVAEKLIEKYSI